MDSPPETPHTRPRWPVDFPLSISVADLAIGSAPFVTESFADLLDSMEESEEQPPGGWVQAQVDGSGAPTMARGPVPVFSGAAQASLRGDLLTPVKRSPRGTKGKKGGPPAVTLVTVLGPTTYKEKEEDESRSLGYVSAQRAALKFLDKFAADQLEPGQASALTQSIDTKTKYPNWKDALQFCYWMRSQGFDTYAQLEPKKKNIKLLIANPATHDRAVDDLYWEQNILTGDIKEFSYNHRRPSRRNALSTVGGSMLDVGFGVPHGAPRGFGLDMSNPNVLQSMLQEEARLVAGLANREHTQQDDQTEQGVQEAPAQPSAADTERAQRLRELVSLQEQLDLMLNISDPDEARLSQVIDRIQVLQQQINGP